MNEIIKSGVDNDKQRDLTILIVLIEGWGLAIEVPFLEDCVLDCVPGGKLSNTKTNCVNCRN